MNQEGSQTKRTGGCNLMKRDVLTISGKKDGDVELQMFLRQK